MTIDAVTAATIAAVMGPFTLLLAGHTMHIRWRPRYGDTAAVTTAVGVLAALVLHESPPLVLLPLLVLGPAAAVVDAYEGRLPDQLTGPLLGATALAATASGSIGIRAIAIAVLAAGLAASVMVVASHALGWGDVKLIPTLTIVLGHQGGLLGGLSLVVLLMGVTAVIVGTGTRGAVVPYGPALVFGTVGAAAGF
ncbi:prepilin peptidase [Pseudonocardia sp.]|uniref:prepilin peptidase n=1 Tax=Pseudonocardia sp. TaxID=60912 RepID=UPI003D0C2114